MKPHEPRGPLGPANPAGGTGRCVSKIPHLEPEDHPRTADRTLTSPQRNQKEPEHG